MGAWGFESYSNDIVMDELASEENFKNYHKPTQQEVDDYFQNGKSMEISLKYGMVQDIIGVLIWILNKGMKVDIKTLKLAVNEALPKMIAYVKKYESSPQKAISYVMMEKKIIQSAIKNDGVATLQYASLGGDVMTHGPSGENYLINATSSNKNKSLKKLPNKSHKKSPKKSNRKTSRKTSRKSSRKSSRKTSRKTSSRKTSRKSRPSPTISATKVEVGTTGKGNDGNTWIVKTNKNGVHRWVKKN